MYFTNNDVREQLQRAIEEVNNTELTETSVYYLHGYMLASIKDAVQVLDRIEKDKQYEKYRQQEEAEFRAHLG